MQELSRDIDQYDKKVTADLLALEDTKNRLNEDIANDIKTHTAANAEYKEQSEEIKYYQRSMGEALLERLAAESNIELSKIRQEYMYTQDMEAQMQALERGGGRRELEQAAEIHKDSPLALVNILEIASKKDILLSIRPYRKEDALDDYVKSLSGQIRTISNYNNSSVTDMASLKFKNSFDNAKRAYQTYSEDSK